VSDDHRPIDAEAIHRRPDPGSCLAHAAGLARGFAVAGGLIAALGAHSYDLLRTALEHLPQTADPQADMVEAGLMFRRFTVEHPALFSIGIQRTLTSELWPHFRAAAADALAVLSRRLARLQDAKLLSGRTVREATMQFHALCEGLAALELRGSLPPKDAERIWRDALTALIAGFAVTPLGADHFSCS
jgi:hypothetical protein